MKPRASTVHRLLALACALALLMSQAAGARAMTLEEERKIGRRAFREVMAQLPQVKDPDVLGYVRGLGRRLASHLKDAPFAFKFYVADEPEFNAFALPGGYIFLFRGLITEMHSEAELAGVMAHEMAHVHHRHLAEMVRRSGPVTAAAIAGMIAGMLLGTVAGVPQLGQAVTIGSAAGGLQKQLAYSREQEAQADYQAFRLLMAAHYPPEEMARSFRRIWRQERYTMPQVPGYLLTHPTSPERLERLEALVKRHPHPPFPYDNHRFLRIRTRLIALYDTPDTARRRLLNLQKQPGRAQLALYGLALLAMREGRFDLALKRFARLTGRWSEDATVLRDRGICHLRLGQYARARRLLRRALALTPKDDEALLALGQSYLQGDELVQAVDSLRRLVARDPDNDQAQYDLGVALGRLGRTAEASLHLGLAFKARGNRRAARYHLQRAVAGLAGRPELQAQARKALKELDKKSPAHGREGNPRS